MDDSYGNGPKPPSIVLDDENFREFFRSQELWLKTRGWLYVFEKSREEFAAVIVPSNNIEQTKQPALNVDKIERFDRHDASARYYTRQLLNTFDRELFDSISCSRDAWRAIKNEYLLSSSKDVRKLEKQITHWKKESGLSIKRAWVQLKELRSKLVEADAQKASAYTETSLFGFLIEGLDPTIYQTAKNVLDLQPNLTRKQRLDSLQNYFEENEEAKERDLSALISRHSDYNRGNPSRTYRRASNQRTRPTLANADSQPSTQEICYMCGGTNHHVRYCEFRHAARQFAEGLRLDKEARERKQKPSIQSQSKRRSQMKTVSFAEKPKAFWSETDQENWSDEDQSEISTGDDEVSAFITDE